MSAPPAFRFLEVEGSWDSGQRLVAIRHVGGQPGADVARAVAVHIERWTGGEPFVLLVDASGAAKIPVAWRAFWMEWFRANRQRMKVAVYRVEALDELTVPVFALVSGVDMRAFASREEALAWLGLRDEGAAKA